MITASQFGQQNGFSQRDLWALEKMYGQRIKSENEWNDILKEKFVFISKSNNSIEEEPKKDIKKDKK